MHSMVTLAVRSSTMVVTLMALLLLMVIRHVVAV